MGEFSKKYSVRGIRGATTVESNSRDLIKDATKELLEDMVSKNEVLSEDIAAVFFTTTSDISDEFPAVAAREMGWDTVPLICGHEMAVPHGLAKCIRILNLLLYLLIIFISSTVLITGIILFFKNSLISYFL